MPQILIFLIPLPLQPYTFNIKFLPFFLFSMFFCAVTKVKMNQRFISCVRFKKV